MNVTVDKALLEQAMRAIFPVMEYGLPGTKDTQQHALQKVYAGLTAALVEPAVEPVAWMTFDGEGGYDLRLYDMNESYRDDYIKRNGEKYASWVQPLYASPPPPAEVATLPIKNAPTREGVFKYLDSEVRKEMAGFYEALNRPQPPAESAPAVRSANLGEEWAPCVNDTVKRIMVLADEYADERSISWSQEKVKAKRQALEAELTRLFTPLSHCPAQPRVL